MTLRWMAAALVFACSATAFAQEPAPLADLQLQILQADKTLFDAFNAKDIATLRTMFTDDLEFYQDDEGLAGYARTIDDFAAMFAQPVHITRELVPGSVEIRPVKGYGAMEIGAHRFCHVEEGKPDCGTFHFVHVWRMDGGHWKIARVVSYGHKLAP